MVGGPLDHFLQDGSINVGQRDDFLVLNYNKCCGTLQHINMEIQTPSSIPRSSNMVLMVTDCLAISTSTGKISPSEDCSFIEGIVLVCIDLKFYIMKTKYVSTRAICGRDSSQDQFENPIIS